MENQIEDSAKLIEELYGIIHSYTIFFLIFDVVFFATVIFVLLLLIKFLKSRQQLKVSGSFLRSTIQGQEDERARIARELHDTVAQDLKYCKTLSEKIGDASLKKDLSEMLNKSIGEIRSMSYNLAPPDITRYDLCANIMNLCKAVSDFSSFEIRLTIPGNVDTKFLSKDENLNLYRMVQESLNNIAKHAKATEVTVLIRNQLGSEQPGLYIFITDDGIGFDATKNYSSGSSHFGLVGMKQRADLIDAKLEVNSMEGEGTQISIIKNKNNL